MTLISKINNIAYINGLQCTFDTKEIRSDIEALLLKSDQLTLPKKYTYIVVNRCAKIIDSKHREEQLNKLINNE